MVDISNDDEIDPASVDTFRGSSSENDIARWLFKVVGHKFKYVGKQRWMRLSRPPVVGWVPADRIDVLRAFRDILQTPILRRKHQVLIEASNLRKSANCADRLQSEHLITCYSHLADIYHKLLSDKFLSLVVREARDYFIDEED